MALPPYSIAGGSVPGAKRFLDYDPAYATANQDGFLTCAFGDYLIVLVGDGCSESSNAQVGMKTSLRTFAKQIAYLCNNPGNHQPFTNFWWLQLEEEFREALRVSAEDLVLPGQNLGKILAEYFLFSFVGAIITPSTAHIFGCGDGIYGIDGTWFGVERFKNNQPPYFAYQLIDGHCGWSREEVSLAVFAEVPMGTFSWLGLASDGVIPLLEPAQLFVPGTTNKVPHLNSLCTDPTTFSNPHRLKQFLLTLVRPSYRLGGNPAELVIEEGVLYDDPTLVAVRFA